MCGVCTASDTLAGVSGIFSLQAEADDVVRPTKVVEQLQLPPAHSLAGSQARTGKLKFSVEMVGSGRAARVQRAG